MDIIPPVPAQIAVVRCKHFDTYLWFAHDNLKLKFSSHFYKKGTWKLLVIRVSNGLSERIIYALRKKDSYGNLKTTNDPLLLGLIKLRHKKEQTVCPRSTRMWRIFCVVLLLALK